MSKQKKYSQLNDFLKSGMTAQEVGNELDETLCDLVHHAGKEGDFSELPNRYYMIKRLRDIFWALEKRKK
ncbi:MAG TPA: hypothetical protein PLM56_18790 [Cyclobacteriaceae bacterium]|nr:hypothetical protein [Cyclobacteriaceae bacterium]